MVERRNRGQLMDTDSNSEMSCCARESTKEVLKNLTIMVPSFYMVLYSLSSIIHAIYGLSFHIRAPFHTKECCLKGSAYQTTGISLIATYFVAAFLFLFVTTKCLWDHIATVTIFHILVTSAVMVEFPTNWQWWVALAIGIFVGVFLGETFAFCIRRRKVRQLEPKRTNNVRS